ncbi:uncharacterized protein METZ01_LOCUS33057 [marine metagenome]|uniref:DoxX family protein n=1 Tax=marine metagenome TaxID=408172 RepID=A0A381QRN2_9ZZZZ
MENIKLIIQIVIAIGIFKVWLLNFKKPSKYRGGNSQNMTEEFTAYGFKHSFMKIIGFSKLSLACFLVAGIWFPNLVDISAFLIGCFMIGAIGFHVKKNDPLIKSLPAFIMLALSSILIIL